VSDQLKQLNGHIAVLEASIAEKSASLKAAQASWDDWKAGNLRAAIGHDQVLLHSLKVQLIFAAVFVKSSMPEGDANAYTQ
jgi:hypothetical protein